jgi:acetyltransferase-like isoleucine patch superfamily enzyme
MIKLLRKLVTIYYILLAKIFYPKCRWIISWNPLAIRGYIFWQKILNTNRARNVAWPVHFTSWVSGDITAGTMTAPGFSPGSYFNGLNGIDFGDNVWIGPGVRVISANHDIYQYDKHVSAERIKIGSNVWIGANAIILPGVSIGNGTVLGAGAVVTKSLPENVVAVGNPARIIKHKK